MDAPSALPDFLAALRRQVAGEVRDDRLSRVLYSTDASLYQVMPLAVLIPRVVDDVQAAVSLAAQFGVPVLARGGGSSLAGQTVNEALVIDFSRYLDGVLEVNREERWARVQPGLVLDAFNLALRPAGLQFGPDPASSNRACVGGVVGNNATGAHSIRYGMTADHVLAMNVVLSDGSRAHFGPEDPGGPAEALARPGLAGAITRAMAAIGEEGADVIRAGTPRHWRRSGGYNLDRLIVPQPESGPHFLWPPDPRFNLARLICGSEGTLAVMTDVTLNLVPLPVHTALAIVPFDTLRAALEAVAPILETDPSAVELLDNLGLTLCRGVPQYARLLDSFLEGDPYCVLVVEFVGDSEAALKDRVAGLANHLRARGVPAGAPTPALTRERQAAVWQVRKAGLGLLMSMRGDTRPVPFIEDAAVPVEHLPDYISRLEQFCADLGTRITYYAHASAGCLHVRPLMNTRRAEEVARMPEIARHAARLLADYDGVLSSEHGDGRSRSWLNEAFFGPELYGLFRQVKAAFDPHGLLNPGNIVDAGPMTENLRQAPGSPALAVRTGLAFRRDGGLREAVEMCNGAGACRQLDAGTMCPSFQVTRDEEHSTRGRANVLRAALTGWLPAEELTSPRMAEVMALCVGCKACLAECPSSVDMARVKVAFLAAHHAAHGTPLRSRLFGHIATVNRLASGPLAPMVNSVLRLGAWRALMGRYLGIDPARPLPPVARVPFTTWFARRARRAPATRGRIALFHDTFATYNEPHIAIAATELLERAGYEVVLPGHRCCGRPMLSNGLVDDARRAAAHTVARLASHAAAGEPIVGLEPSCLLTLRDEYADLLPDDPRVAAVAAAAQTFEEFVAERAAAGELDLGFGGASRELLLHGHCHQKALVGTGPARAALALPPGYRVRELDAGCCGMAGAFGYERENRRWSVAMGERRLMPAVRAAGEGVIVVAAGTSCRQQIAHLTGRRAWHPAEVLRAALG